MFNNFSLKKTSQTIFSSKLRWLITHSDCDSMTEYYLCVYINLSHAHRQLQYPTIITELTLNMLSKTIKQLASILVFLKALSTFTLSTPRTIPSQHGKFAGFRIGKHLHAQNVSTTRNTCATYIITNFGCVSQMCNPKV